MSSEPSTTQTRPSKKPMPTTKPASRPSRKPSVDTAKRARPRGVAQRQKPATDRQEEFLEAVALLTERLGHAPSNNEVGEHMGVSRWWARKALMALASKGLVADVPKTVSSGQWALTETARKARAGR